MDSDQRIKLLVEIINQLEGRKAERSELAKQIQRDAGLESMHAKALADIVVSYAEMYAESAVIASKGGMVDVPVELPDPD